MWAVPLGTILRGCWPARSLGQYSFILPALGIPSANPSEAGAFEGLFHTNAPENLVPGFYFPLNLWGPPALGLN